jgi:DNA polymerase-4
MSRAVLFAEVPCFYASVECADGPSHDTRPVIVGGDPRRRGSVQAAAPEALAAGVRVGMPMLEALRLCPRARSARTDMIRYREVSRRLLVCLRRGFARLEPFGLGAAYLDVTGDPDPPEVIAERLRATVRDQMGLPLRVGIASGKFPARLAAEELERGAADPQGGGVRRIPPGREQAFLDPLPASRLEGVGQKTAARLAELGASTIGGVVALGRERLQEVFGIHGLRIYDCASGLDQAPVRASRHPQSLSREAAVGSEPSDLVALAEGLQDLARHLEAELHLQGLTAGKVSLKLRFADQATTTRSRTLSSPTSSAGEIQEVAERLLGRTQAGSRPVRGLGIQLARLAPAAARAAQLDLFPPRR